eukprot:SAG11_NODE_9985_length_864_cov_32.670588_1_plen_89_part_00
MSATLTLDDRAGGAPLLQDGQADRSARVDVSGGPCATTALNRSSLVADRRPQRTAEEAGPAGWAGRGGAGRGHTSVVVSNLILGGLKG